MKKINKIVFTLLALTLITGCGASKKAEQKKEEKKPVYDKDASVVKDQIFTGLEFVNIGIEGGEIKTSVINNTGVVYEPSTFTIKVKDEKDKVIVEVKGNIEEAIPNGETRVVTTNTNADLSKAYSIEYSVN